MSYSLSDIDRQIDRQKWWDIHDPDTYICPDCGRTKEQHGKKWEVHHIDCEAGDIVGLCHPCHKIRHGADVTEIDLEAWKAGFLGNDPQKHREDRSQSPPTDNWFMSKRKQHNGVRTNE